MQLLHLTMSCLTCLRSMEGGSFLHFLQFSAVHLTQTGRYWSMRNALGPAGILSPDSLSQIWDHFRNTLLPGLLLKVCIYIAARIHTYTINYMYLYVGIVDVVVRNLKLTFDKSIQSTHCKSVGQRWCGTILRYTLFEHIYGHTHTLLINNYCLIYHKNYYKMGLLLRCPDKTERCCTNKITHSPITLLQWPCDLASCVRQLVGCFAFPWGTWRWLTTLRASSSMSTYWSCWGRSRSTGRCFRSSHRSRG